MSACTCSLDEAAIIYIMQIFARAHGISLARVSLLAAGDGKFAARLLSGRTCTLRVAHKVLQYLSDHWLEDLDDWPDEIWRPAPRSRGERQVAA